MLSTSNADKAWKGMTRSFPTPEAPGRCAAPSKAERTAYAVLLQGPAARSGGADASQWLLLRDRTGPRCDDRGDRVMTAETALS
jgi:hypothetical protein